MSNKSGNSVSEVRPHFKIVVIDETEYWSDSFKARAGKIFRAYLFDCTRHVHCCEITPSYELHPLYSTALNGNDDDGEFMSEIDSEEAKSGLDVVYMHVRCVDKMKADHFFDYGVKATMPESYEELLKEYIEAAHANVQIQIPASVERELEPA